MKNGDALKSVLLMGLAVAAVGGGLVYWQWSARADAQARVGALEAQIPDGQQLQTQLDASTTQLTEIQAQLDHLENNIPSTAYVPTLLAELELVGEQSQLAVTGVRPIVTMNTSLLPEEDKPYKEIEIDITGQGTYGSVMSLVGALQRFPKVLAVRTVSLTPRQDLLSTSTDLDATVRLRAFVFKDAESDSTEKGNELASAQKKVNNL